MATSRNNHHIMAILAFLAFAPLCANAQRLGADLAAPSVSDFLKTLPLKAGQMYVFSAQDTERFVDLAAQIHINVFEALDCTFRYIKPLNVRVTVMGAELRKLQSRYDLGGERVLAILSVDKLRYLETGANLSPGQCDLDIFLDSPTEKYIEIGTAVYATRFGFRKLSPLLFDQAYGITVKKLVINTTLEKLELFEPGKGAIYVKALPRPKRWNLNVVRKL
ncbi:MAG TPA: hypothetical protein PK542_07765 [Treponemataceae bacterium]|nr:hypothetical protein [Treponemataceae bacterium]HPS44368.1 hypothetical protein [Treponemataceae bacterium]